MSAKSTIKMALRWTVPAGVNDFLLAEWRRLASSGVFDPELRRTLAANRIFQNAHQGERGFILGTGASIKSQDLKPLQQETCIAMSNFYLHKDYAVINPRYQVTSGLVSHSLISKEIRLQWLREVEERIVSDVLWFSYADRRFIQEYGLFQNRRVHYWGGRHNWRAFWKQGIDATRPLYPTHGVAAKTLQLALYLGFREIYLLGLDHDYLVRLTPNTSTYFYEPAESIIGRSGMQEWDHLFLENRQLAVWKDYEILRRFAEARGVKICNATAGGYLDVFERVDYRTLFAHAVERW